MMKKAAIILLVVLMLVGAFACTTNEIKEPSSVSTVTEGTTVKETAKAENTEPAEQPDNTDADVETDPTKAPSGKVTVEEAVLVDEQGVKITLKSLESGGYFGPELKLLIENDSGKSLTFSVKDFSVNGYMNDASLYAEVANEKKANDTINISKSDLTACGIDTIADMEFKFHIYDSENWDDYLTTDPISLKTSAYEGFEYTYDEEGFVAFEDNGVKIVVKGLTDESVFGPGILFYIVNTSDKNVTITTRDVSINGFMVSDVFYCDVLAGKHAVDATTFMSSSLEENGIEEIEDVELSFHISDADSWRTIADSDPIKISFD